MNVQMSIEPEEPKTTKPLAGTCHHHWQKVDAPFYRAQVCEYCKLYRYKAARAAVTVSAVSTP